MGSKIDAHDSVMRLKHSVHLLQRPAHYGSKTDHVLASYTVGAQILETWPDCPSFFLFTDTRTENMTKDDLVIMAKRFGERQITIDHNLCQYWVQAYRQNRCACKMDSRQEQKAALSDDLGHRHPSAGFFSIVYMLTYLKPDAVTLYGFDSLLSGVFDWSVTRGENWSQYPDHNWNTESRLFPFLCGVYGYNASILTNGTVEIKKI